MDRQIIKEALQQGHKNLGLSGEVFERVAASVETFISDEETMAAYVKSEGCLNLLKSYQSVNDKLRAFEKKNAEAEKKAPEVANNPEEKAEKEDEPAARPMSAEEIAKVINDAVANAVTPLQARIGEMEAANAQKSAIEALEARIASDPYAKNYAKESAKAKSVAIALYEAGGKKQTGEELVASWQQWLNGEIKEKGLDCTQPFKSEGNGGESEPDFSNLEELLAMRGIELPKDGDE